MARNQITINPECFTQPRFKPRLRITEKTARTLGGVWSLGRVRQCAPNGRSVNWFIQFRFHYCVWCVFTASLLGRRPHSKTETNLLMVLTGLLDGLRHQNRQWYLGSKSSRQCRWQVVQVWWVCDCSTCKQTNPDTVVGKNQNYIIRTVYSWILTSLINEVDKNISSWESHSSHRKCLVYSWRNRQPGRFQFDYSLT